MNNTYDEIKISESKDGLKTHAWQTKNKKEPY